MSLRFGIWAAVSTIEQTEGASLQDQVKRCLAHGRSAGWKHAGTWQAPGYSRTGYIGLEEAMRDIPPLAECIHAMRTNRYDVLCMTNFDRLGDVVVMVANDFRNNKKQLYSLAQPSQVFEQYDPYGEDTSFILQALAPIWQRQRISDLRRKWRVGMPKRIENGLTPLSVPFGYKWRGKKEPPEAVPAQLELVKQMGEWLRRARRSKRSSGAPMQPAFCHRGASPGTRPRSATSCTTPTIPAS